MAVFNHMSLNPRFFLGVEHNQFKKGPAFLWHLTIEYGPKSYDKDKKDRTFIDTLLVYTLWYDFWNDFDAQSDFTKKLVLWNHTFLKYALEFANFLLLDHIITFKFWKEAPTLNLMAKL